MTTTANGAAAAANGAEDGPSEFKLKFCTVCASNQNRYAMTLPTPVYAGII